MNLRRNICYNMLITYDPRMEHFLLIVPKKNSDPNIVKNTSNTADLNSAHKYMQLEHLLCSLDNTRLFFRLVTWIYKNAQHCHCLYVTEDLNLESSLSGP